METTSDGLRYFIYNIVEADQNGFLSQISFNNNVLNINHYYNDQYSQNLVRGCEILLQNGLKIDWRIKDEQISISVYGIDDLLWHKLRYHFLKFIPEKKYSAYETPFGFVMGPANASIRPFTHSQFSGLIYINDVLVEMIDSESEQDLAFLCAYNINPGLVFIDENGKVDRYALKSVVGDMWCYLFETHCWSR